MCDDSGAQLVLSLADVLVNVFNAVHGRMTPKVKARHHAFVREVAVGLGVMWESTRADAMCEEEGHIDFGSLEGAKRKRRFSPGFMRSVATHARNAGGQGVSKTGQILLGLAVAKRKGPVARVPAAKRRKGELRRSAMRSSAAHFVDNECYNYFEDCRRSDSHQ